MGLDETIHLFEDAFDGDDVARNDLFERLRPRLLLWVSTRMSPALRAKVEPDDVAQEVLLAVEKAFDGFEGREFKAFLAWVFTIAENRIRDQVDRHGAKKRQPPPPEEAPVPDPPTTPSQIAARNEGLATILDALAALRPEHQEVIRLRLLQQLEVREVAEIMDRSENAVRVLYCRALKALREAMSPSEFAKG